VRGECTGVIEKESGIGPFFEQREPGSQKREASENVPNPQNGHEIWWITEVPDYADERLEPQCPHSSANNAFSAKY
jgi:hypothetical protein